jgi:hypothetical protein
MACASVLVTGLTIPVVGVLLAQVEQMCLNSHRQSPAGMRVGERGDAENQPLTFWLGKIYLLAR